MLIYLNDVNTGSRTSATIENVPIGSHRVKLVHSKYISQEKLIQVIGGEITHVSFDMLKATAQLTVNTTNDAIIRINGRVVGTTSWTGWLEEGEHTINVDREGYVSRQHVVSIVRGRDINIDLMMRTMTGTLEIITDPPQAMITLNGRMYGLTPRTIPDLPLGNYSLTLEKHGHTTMVMRVNITDSEVKTLEVPLASGREVEIHSEPAGASVIINQEDKGFTPLTIWLEFGSHVVRLEKGDMSVVESMNVLHAGKRVFSFKLEDTKDLFEGLMIFVEGGAFRMGDTFGDGNREEKPVHPVTLSDFFISKYQVTQSQWTAIMGENPSHFSGCEECPIERVSWYDVQDFLKRLNELTGKNYRLPTEAEWEFAAKGGALSMGYRYAGRNNINFVSWFSGNSGNRTHPVGQKEPNELGLYDMSGNVWEWTNDWFGYYTDSPKTNPTGPENGDFKIVKGGSWFGYIGGSRPPCRGSDDPSNRRSYIGFRVALSP